MAFARLIMPGDETAVLELARINVEENLPHLDFDPEVTAQTIADSITTGNPTGFVCESDGQIVGYAMCRIEGYAFTTGIFVILESIYVHPDKRGTRAAAAGHLIRAFKGWGDIVGAREKIVGTANGYKPEQVARLFERFGAVRKGYYMKIEEAG